jgi:hypothetical protein
MRIAFLTDIHGNLPALEAVLATRGNTRGCILAIQVFRAQ